MYTTWLNNKTEVAADVDSNSSSHRFMLCAVVMALQHCETHTSSLLLQAIDRSCSRLGMPTLDLVQFYWQDYSIKKYVAAAQQLKALQEQGRIRHIGVTNFDVPRLREMIDAGVPIVSNQVCYCATL